MDRLNAHAIPLESLGADGCCSPLVAPLAQVVAESISADFQLFAHPIRVQILSVLARNSEPVCVCDLESAVAVKQPTVSYHLKLLRDAGVVTYERRGVWAYYSLDRTRLAERQARLVDHTRHWE